MITFEKVTKKFKNGTLALSDINLEIADNEFIFLTGPSGAGKSTLIKLLLKDIAPTEGKISLDDWEITKLSPQKIPALRRKIGVVFQELKLLMDRTVYENVALVLEVLGKKEKEIKEEVIKVLDLVGISDLMDKFPLQLSGGELQRTAIARALVRKPKIFLADEPTADLDPATSWEILNILSEINKGGATVVMATHNMDIVNAMVKRVVSLNKGKIVNDQLKGKYKTR